MFIEKKKREILFRFFAGSVGIWTTLLFFCAVPVRALDPRKVVTQYVHDVWTSNEGLPQDTISAIVQTPDGYLWLATQEGVARFDGAKFTIFDSSNTEKMGGLVYALFVDGQGTMWVGTGDGLLAYRDGQFTRYSTKDGLPDVSVKNISEDARGNLWLGTATGDRATGGHGLTEFKDHRGTIYSLKDGLSNDQVHKTLTGKRGELWIATGNGLNLYENGKFKTFTVADGLCGNLVKTLYQDRAGRLWIGTTSGLTSYENGAFTSYTTDEGLSDNFVLSIYEDKDGIVWVGTYKGLNRFIGGELQVAEVDGIKETEGLADDQILSFYEDREGSFWIGTHAHGLHRLRDAKFTTYGAPEGLLGENVRAVYQDRAERIWVGTSPGGISVLEDNQFLSYNTIDGLLSKDVRVLYEDRAGALWIGTDLGLDKFKDGNFTAYTAADGLLEGSINSVYEDEHGWLWLGTNAGLSILRNGKFTNFTEAGGVPGNAVNFVYRDRAKRFLVGGNDGIKIFENDNFVPLYNDFPKDFNPQSLVEDADGTLWIATWGQGLHRLKNGKLNAFTTRDGLYDNTAWSLLEDDNGNLWMGGNRGIFHVSKQELNDLADGKINRVSCIVYGTANGMRKRETNAGSPSAIKTRDGKFWFGTTDGVVVIDPNHVKTNDLPPPVVIEKLVVDENAVAPNNQNFEFDAGTKKVQFDYVGLSLVAPELVHYKYKLEGFDQEWVDAGNRRTAYYTNISPGNYVFTVIAANNDGVWNETGASLKFRVLMPFWRTGWFLGLFFLALSGIVLLLFNWRIARLERTNQMQTAFSRRLIESQERERKRIAAELHDNLGQQLVIIKNWAALGLKFTEKTAPARAQLEEISATALQAINEVREIINDLRPHQLETIGLASTVKFMVEQAAASSGINFTVDCDHLNDLFSPEEKVVIYRIVQECVTNIVKHSEAENASVMIQRDEQTVKIKITDDGRGFAAEALPQPDARAGFGLSGLNERAGMLGAAASIQSVIGKGTTISMEIAV